MKKTPKVYLYNIIESIEAIEEYICDQSKEALLSERRLQDLVIRRLQIVGEASNRIPESLQKDHPEIPWQKIRGLRNVIIHDYAVIDFELVWEVIKKDLPELKDNAKKIMKKY